MSNAWVTLATNDTYAIGGLVLSESLQRVKSNAARVILVTDGVSAGMVKVLEKSFTEVKLVKLMSSDEDAILAYIKRPELGVTLTKIHCWNLTNYQKCVFLDADTLVIKNCDELFERKELSAVPDIGWTDTFNSGVFVFEPNEETFKAIMETAKREGTYDGGDQGLLNTYFNKWFESPDHSKHLSFIYNATITTCYSYPPAYNRFGKNIKIVHFLGTAKPWNYGYCSSDNSIICPYPHSSFHQLNFVQTWWNLFIESVQPMLTSDCVGLASSLSSLMITDKQLLTETTTRRRAWESGVIDYLGHDSFANIQAKLDASLSGPK